MRLALQLKSFHISTKALLFLLFFSLFSLKATGSEIPNFNNLSKTKNSVFFLSTKRSGSNLVSSSLSAITHKPISWLEWKYKVFYPGSKFQNHPSYNRLRLPLISDQPLLYRTHFSFDKLRQIPSDCNRLIFVTRNPKELIFREFLLKKPGELIPDQAFIDTFLKNILHAYEIYEQWNTQNRMIVFYEDFICKSDDILLELCAFMKEEPLFFDDYRHHKEEYFENLLSSYKAQHRLNRGGLSSSVNPQPIYYTRNIPFEVLTQIDAYLESKSPELWDKYFKRFKTTPL